VPDVEREGTSGGGRAFPWAVFVLSFALLLSDFTSRNVLVPAFPLIRRDWAVSDAQLGALTGVSVAVVLVLLTGRRLDTRASRDGLRPAGVGLPEHGRTVRGG
jgi:hypothetical protein